MRPAKITGRDLARVARRLAVLGALGATAVAARVEAQIVVDPLGTPQAPVSASFGGPAGLATVAAPDALGLERDVRVEALGPGSLQAEVTAALTIDGTGPGEAAIAWDGADGDADALATTGLGAVDLTAGGAGALVLVVARASAGTTLLVELSGASGRASVRAVVLPEISGSEDVVLPFSSFLAIAGGGASAAAVGAVRLFVRGADLAFTLERVETRAIAASVAAAKAVDKATATPGETLAYTVTARSSGADAALVEFTDTVDPSTAVQAGSLEVSPLAFDDAYATGSAGLAVAAAGGVLANDVDPDGDALVAGGADAVTSRGGAVAVQADGSFSYTVPAGGLTVPDSFSYEADDGNGITDRATVVLVLDEAPAVVALSPAPGASGVAPDTAVRVDFSEDVDVAAGGLTVECPSGTAAPFTASPALPATATRTITLTPGPSWPGGETCTLAVLAAKVTDSDPADPPDTLASGVAATFGIRPDAADDTVSVTTHLQRTLAAPGVLANDTLGAAAITGSGTTAGDAAAVAPGDALTTSAGGTAVLAVDGTLTYNPPPGRSSGTDSFYYTVSGAAGTDVALVTLSIAGPTIWFVDAGAGPGGDGTLLRPFDTLAAYAGAAAVDPGDALFVASGSYTCGIALAPGQTLFGTGSSDGFAALTGISPVAGSLPLPSLAGPAPVLTAAGGTCLTLSTGNRLQSLALGDRGAAGTAILGNAFGVLTARQVTIQGTGRTLGLTSGTLDAVFGAVGSTASSTDGLLLQAVAGSLVTGPVSVSGSAGFGVRVQGSPASVAFGATVVSRSSAGAAVSLAGNAGATSFASLAATASAGDALVATDNPGAVAVLSATGSSLTATGGAALSVTNATLTTPIDLSFATIATTDSPASGIRLSRVSGTGLSVAGPTAIDLAAGSGVGIDVATATTTALSLGPASTVTVADRRATGIQLSEVSGTVALGNTTIANPNGAAGYGLRIQGSSAAVTVAQANISGTVAGTAETYEAVRDTPLSDGDGDAIFVSGLTGSLTVNGGTISNTGGHAVDLRSASNVALANLTISSTKAGAIQGIGVSGFSLADTSITLFGDEVDNDPSGNEITEAALRFRDLSGTASVRRTTIENDGAFAVTQFPAGPPNRGIELFNRGVSLTLTIAGVTFDRISNDAIVASAETGTLNLYVDGTTVDGANTFTQVNGFGVDAFEEARPGTVNLVVRGSLFDQVGAAVRFAAAPGAVTAATIASNTILNSVTSAIVQRGLSSLAQRATVTGTIQGNTISQVGTYGAAFGGRAVDATAEDGMTATLRVDGNGASFASDNKAEGIRALARRQADLSLVAAGNTVSTSESDGVRVQSTDGTGVGAGPSTTCTRLSANDVTAAASGVPQDYLLVQQGTSLLRLEGFAGGDAAAVAAFVDGANTGPDTVQVVGTVVGAPGACRVP